MKHIILSLTFVLIMLAHVPAYANTLNGARPPECAYVTVGDRIDYNGAWITEDSPCFVYSEGQISLDSVVPIPTGECTHYNSAGVCMNYYTRVTEDTSGWTPNSVEAQASVTWITVVRDMPITEDDPRWTCATMGNRICGDAMHYVSISQID